VLARASSNLLDWAGMSQLEDIHQPVRTFAEDIVKIHYQDTTNEDMEDYVCVAVTMIFRVSKSVAL
jgi:hypothetical protein